MDALFFIMISNLSLEYILLSFHRYVGSYEKSFAFKYDAITCIYFGLILISKLSTEGKSEPWIDICFRK